MAYYAREGSSGGSGYGRGGRSGIGGASSNSSNSYYASSLRYRESDRGHDRGDWSGGYRSTGGYSSRGGGGGGGGGEGNTGSYYKGYSNENTESRGRYSDLTTDHYESAKRSESHGSNSYNDNNTESRSSQIDDNENRDSKYRGSYRGSYDNNDRDRSSYTSSRKGY